MNLNSTMGGLQMIWLVYEDFRNTRVKIGSSLKYLSPLSWMLLAFLIIVTFGLLALSIYLDINIWLIIITLFLSSTTGLYFGNKLRKLIRSKYGSHEDIYNTNINHLKNILNKRNLYTKTKIESLIEQYNEELPSLKISDKALKPINGIAITFLLPISTLLIKWMLDNKSGPYLIIVIIMMIVMLLSLYYMLKPLIENLFDREMKHMMELKRLLQDILIIDFY